MSLLALFIPLLLIACSSDDGDSAQETAVTSAPATSAPQASATTPAAATSPATSTNPPRTSAEYAVDPAVDEQSCDEPDCKMVVRFSDVQFDATGVRVRLTLQNGSPSQPIIVQEGVFNGLTALYLFSQSQLDAWKAYVTSNGLARNPLGYLTLTANATKVRLRLRELPAQSPNFTLVAPGQTFTGTLETSTPIAMDTVALVIWAGPFNQGPGNPWEFATIREDGSRIFLSLVKK